MSWRVLPARSKPCWLGTTKLSEEVTAMCTAWSRLLTRMNVTWCWSGCTNAKAGANVRRSAGGVVDAATTIAGAKKTPAIAMAARLVRTRRVGDADAVAVGCL